MFFKRLFATKSIEQLHKEMAEDEGRLRRALGPVALTSLGIGAIIGAGIFVMTGRVAADNAGPGILLSYAFAGVGCALAAFCYAEFASMAPVAGSAYTYAYATLGELLAWIIGWDLILEYAMSCATVASAWSEYFNKFTEIVFHWKVPDSLSNDPFSFAGAYLNLPAVLILVVITAILVIGIRESAISNTVLVIVKLGVVLFVIFIGFGYVSSRNWTSIFVEDRKMPEQTAIPDASEKVVKAEDQILKDAQTLSPSVEKSVRKVLIELQGGQTETVAPPSEMDQDERIRQLTAKTLAIYLRNRIKEVNEELLAKKEINPEEAKERTQRIEEQIQKIFRRLDKDDKLHLNNITPEDERRAVIVLKSAKEEASKTELENWGLLGMVGLNKWLAKLDNSTRTRFTPYGLSGVMLGAALVFFAFIGFDSISTHAEEAKRPQRDVPIGIIASLVICTVLYILVSAVITGMEQYQFIDTKAAIASAFDDRANIEEGGRKQLLKVSAALIAAGGLAGMTSVLLITFLSQARVFLAMARDGFMPPGIFGAVHAKFKTPHISTMLTGAIICVVAAFTPIQDLEKMVNIGTLFAFVVVCGAVFMLRVKRPDVHRPFRAPALFIVAPLGILVNVIMMVVLPPMTWARLVVWLLIGLVIYFSYGYWHSKLRKQVEQSAA